MFEDRYYLLKLVDQMGREVRGRKKLQKATHLLRAFLPGFDIPCEFTYHHYGPYSSDLSTIVGDAAKEGLLVETPEEIDNNIVAYKYLLTEKGLNWIGEMEKNKRVEPLSVVEENTLRIVQNIRDASSSVLEVASTVIFLMEYGEGFADAVAQAENLKAHLSEHFKEAFSLAREIADYRSVHQHC